MTALAQQNFTLKNQYNTDISLADFKGKTVVLEWLNHGCPFVRKHYDSKNMQNLQDKWTAKGIIWLSIISSAPGKQGHVTPQEAYREAHAYKSRATHILLDPEGKVGKMYEAKTTPHMYVINPEGKRVYEGAIDNIPDTNQASIPKAQNFVDETLTQLISGQKIKTAKTKAYGCSVKYAD